MRWAGHVAQVEDKSFKFFVRKSEYMAPLGRNMRRWMDTIKMSLKEIL
jgi:hypothetical protein